MGAEKVEERLNRLESSIVELQAEVRRKNGKDWRRTIGAFTDDAEMQEILKEAMSLRDADRATASREKPTKRKPRS